MLIWQSANPILGSLELRSKAFGVPGDRLTCKQINVYQSSVLRLCCTWLGQVHQHFQRMFCAIGTVWYQTCAEQRCRGDKVDRTCGPVCQIGVSLFRTTGSLPGVKWPGREFHSSRPYSLEIKNEWRYTFTASVRFPRVDRSNDVA